MKFLILDYIKKINKNDIYNFMKSNNIYLNNEELENIHILLKDNNILNYSDNDYEVIIKNNVKPHNFQNTYNLFIQYKKEV